jgi:hypothetical protein
MRLFSYYDTILYTLSTEQKQTLVRNIMKKVNIRQAVKGEREAFIEYKLKDSDRPEIIAHKVYGSADYHWIILLTRSMGQETGTQHTTMLTRKARLLLMKAIF